MLHANSFRWGGLLVTGALWMVLPSCGPGDGPGGRVDDGPMDDGPVAEGISAPLGEIMPSASTAQRATFARGLEVMNHRFDLAEGLGPAFNITFCAGCHERPTAGGSSGLYRNFYLGGRLTGDGAFVFSDSAGDAGGVMRLLQYGGDGDARPAVPESTTVFSQRNAIPMFGVGLLAELSEAEILSRSDPEDANADGISGRPNFDRGFVGRFGRKAQTVSIEGFIRGPIFNHLEVTTVPLTEAQKAQLPVDSATREVLAAVARQAPGSVTRSPHQAAAPDAPTEDDDAAPDPEMSAEDLFDLVSFVMLLGAPELDQPTEQSNRGRLLFHEAGCADCHAPRLDGPRGPLPVYSDLLLHDMGAGLADGIVMNEASGSEFRTQPLWGLSATGPYLHDGRALTVHEAILAHGGEADEARRAYEAFSSADQADLEAFLMSLGGRSQQTPGMLPPQSELPAVGAYGGPFRALNATETEQFLRGRGVFDRDFGFSDGLGGLAGRDGAGRFNGDSCRACHFDPVIGGAGPRGVNVMRHGRVEGDGRFTAPPDTPNTILHKISQIDEPLVSAHGTTNVFEHRQTPHAFGMGLIDAISEATIRAGEDPDDADGDGISGRAHVLADGRIGRLGWKAQVPSTAEFVGDAMAAEIGLTLPEEAALSFSMTADQDEVPDPELSRQDTEAIIFFLATLAGPPRQTAGDADQISLGEGLFATVGCSNCHIPEQPSALGDVPLYSDLLLHEILPPGQSGIADGDAGQREFRTAPLWGLSKTAPYFHDGEADTIDAAIRMHDGEARAIRDAYMALDAANRAALLAFLGSL